MTKPELGFRGFWIAVAAVCVTGGSYLRVFGGHPVAGNRLVYSGLGLAALLVFGVLGERVTAWIVPASSPALGVLRWTGRFVVDSISWLGASLLRPVVWRVLRENRAPETPPSALLTQCWTAQEKRGPQNSDFLCLSKAGHVVSSAHFELRPDYSFRNWYAGFRLTSATDEPLKSGLTDTVLFHLCDDAHILQPRAFLYVERRAQGPFALRQFEWPRPSFAFDISVFPAAAGELRIIVSIDKELVKSADFPTRYAEQLVLVAWADGREFCLHFEQISVHWRQMDQAKK